MGGELFAVLVRDRWGTWKRKPVPVSWGRSQDLPLSGPVQSCSLSSLSAVGPKTFRHELSKRGLQTQPRSHCSFDHCLSTPALPSLLCSTLALATLPTFLPGRLFPLQALPTGGTWGRQGGWRDLLFACYLSEGPAPQQHGWFQKLAFTPLNPHPHSASWHSRETRGQGPHQAAPEVWTPRCRASCELPNSDNPSSSCCHSLPQGWELFFQSLSFLKIPIVLGHFSTVRPTAQCCHENLLLTPPTTITLSTWLITFANPEKALPPLRFWPKTSEAGRRDCPS